MKLWLVQMEPRLYDKEANAAKMVGYVEKAAGAGIDLVAFPELALTGYMCRQRFPELAEPVPGPSTEGLIAAARRTGVHIVLGMPEARGPYVFNSAVLLKPDGPPDIWRKLVLATAWTPLGAFDEGMYFKPGVDIVTANTRFGRIGLEICRDLYYPEIDRAHSHRGAFLLLCISAAPYSNQYIVPPERFQLLGRTSALQNCCWFAYVNRVGVEDGFRFGGSSFVANQRGELQRVASQGDESTEETLEVTIDVEAAMQAKRASVFVRDARADIMERAAAILREV